MSQKWNMDTPWERKSDYILRCIEETFAPSNGGNPMVTLKFEVAAPEEVEINGEMRVVAGVPITSYNVTKSMKGYTDNQGNVVTPEMQTAKKQAQYIKLLNAFEIPSDNINWDSPPLGFKGKCVYAMLENDATEQRGSPTKADLAKGIKVGPILMNPKTKQPLVKNYPKIVEIYGIAEVANTGAL